MNDYDEYYPRREPHGLETLIAVIDGVLNTKRKRHITGGILISASLLFGGLAFTVMTIKNEDKREKEGDEDE